MLSYFIPCSCGTIVCDSTIHRQGRPSYGTSELLKKALIHVHRTSCELNAQPKSFQCSPKQSLQTVAKKATKLEQIVTNAIPSTRVNDIGHCKAHSFELTLHTANMRKRLQHRSPQAEQQPTTCKQSVCMHSYVGSQACVLSNTTVCCTIRLFVAQYGYF